MIQKAMEAKLVRKAQRQAALDAAKVAKKEKGYLRWYAELFCLAEVELKSEWKNMPTNNSSSRSSGSLK